MSKRKTYRIEEVPPGVDTESLGEGGIIQDPGNALIKDPGPIISEAAFDSMIRDEVRKTKPVRKIGPFNLGQLLSPRWAGHSIEAEDQPGIMLPEEPMPDDLEKDYRFRLRITAPTQAELAPSVDALIRAGQEEIKLGPVALYLHAVQGHDRIIGPGAGMLTRGHAVSFYSVELTYIYRVKPTPESQEV